MKIHQIVDRTKKTILFWSFVLIGLLVVSSTRVLLQAAIPASERAALIAFYNATNGNKWWDNSNWKGVNNETDGFSEIGSEDNWYGIRVSNDHVTGIHLYEKNLVGSIPPELGNLSNLLYLYLTDNQLSGSIPPELGNLSNLLYLYLSDNQLSGSIPLELGNLSDLKELILDDNNLMGPIPPELGNLSNLLHLYLFNNQLSGSIPSELGNLSNLKNFYLGFNKLSGSIPPELKNLPSLIRLSLAHNQLSGSIPSELGNLSDLSSLALSNNQLSGSIPSELGNLSNLRSLNLNSNYLSGNIPTRLTNLTNLGHINIRDNCLYTDDPDLRTWLNNLDQDWERYQCEEEKDPPFGSFDTPIDGSTVASSIPLTGWALDDTGIDTIKIYRKHGDGLLYIGDAILVEGARPDVAVKYPDYPFNTKAGWGYMMLTNFLPNSGNGTFMIHAIATDFAGKTTTLGTKTIHCNNADAVEPFGAIDTPAQGGTASGNSFLNWGWVLTPQPNSIPTDGSTIEVWVNGVKIGHPTYNIYRSDIANLFPGYANSDGAVGYFYLDTTPYKNGVHVIHWTAKDNAGNSDGIGSKYFTTQNTGGDQRSSVDSGQWTVGSKRLMQIPLGYSTPVRIKAGYNENMKPQKIYPDGNGIITIEINQLEPVKIQLDDNYDNYKGFLLVGRKLKKLPIGSTLDSERGLFSWYPGPGFVGNYQLLFILNQEHKKRINIKISPER